MSTKVINSKVGHSILNYKEVWVSQFPTGFRFWVSQFPTGFSLVSQFPTGFRFLVSKFPTGFRFWVSMVTTGFIGFIPISHLFPSGFRLLGKLYIHA